MCDEFDIEPSLSNEQSLSNEPSFDNFAPWHPYTSRKSLQKAIKKIVNVEPEKSTSGGTSDARFITKICPVIEFGLVGKTMHKTDENVEIDDIVNLYKLLAENLYKNPKKFSGEVFNAGTNIRHKIKDIIKEIFTYGKKNKELKEIFIKMHKNKTSGELVAQYMDYEKLNNYLGWKPKFKFSNTLPDLFNWYKKYFKKK